MKKERSGCGVPGRVADWTAAELDAAARDAAFDAEVEEFCLALLTGAYPADFVPEDGAAESEASAE